jgi:hypothetical protein
VRAASSLASVAATRQSTEPISAGSWGWLPALSLTTAFGLVLMAAADDGGRWSASWAYPLFWIGLLVMFVPTAWRLVSATPTRQERMGLLVMLGIGLYVIKLLQSPTAFLLMDESAHWRTLADIVRTGHLFGHNPLLPVSPFYPGLESATSALVTVSGLTPFAAARVLTGVARVIIVLALYLLYEHLSSSGRVAGIASLLYIANPGFLFFDTQFAYESVALPLAALVLFALSRRSRSYHRSHVGLTVVALLGLGAVVITHHVTSYALAGFLTIWAVAAFIQRRHQVGSPVGPGGVAVLAIAAALSWLLYVASLTIGYLSPQLQGAMSEFFRLITGEMTSRQLFHSSSGQVAPLWERITSVSSVGLILLGLPFGLLQIWRRHRFNALALTLAAGALAYPVSLAVRLTERGAEASNRSSEFLFVAIAFVFALGLVELGLSRGTGWNRPCLAVAGVSTIFFGGIIAGTPGWARLPGPYLVAGDARSIDQEGVDAAAWAATFLGPGNRIVADRTNASLMGTIGDQRPVTGYGDQQYAYLAVFSPNLGPSERRLLRQAGVRYLVIDRRLSTALPMVGVYFEIGEPNAMHQTTPFPDGALAKFDAAPDMNRIFDSGDIVIYGTAASAGAIPDVPPIQAAPPTDTGFLQLLADLALRATRLIVGSVLVLLLPGFAITAATFAGRRLDTAERLLFSLGLSLAIGALGGIVLNGLPFGLGTASWTILLGGITLAAGTVWLVRRRRPLIVSMDQSARALKTRGRLLLALAVAVVMAAWGIAVVAAAEQPSSGFSQLWMLPTGAADHPLLLLGMKSTETRPTRYTLDLVQGGVILSEWHSADVAPGQEWHVTTAVPTGLKTSGTVEARLYRTDAPDVVYRRVELHLGQVSGAGT